MLSGLFARLRALFRPGALDRDIRAEIDAHLARDADQLIARGSNPADAAAEAQRLFGNVTVDREYARDAYGWTWPAHFAQDIRYARRALLRTPGFTATTVISLGLAIGANATIFSAIDALLLRHLPVTRPDRLVTLEQTGQGDNRSPNLSFGDYERFKRLAVFSGMVAVTWADAFNVAAPAGAVTVDPSQLRVSIVTGNYFEVLGVRPIAGRLLAESDDEHDGAHPVVVISDDYWARRFARSPAAIGSPVTILDTSYTIVGVAPPAFHGDWVGWPTDIWAPVAMGDQVSGTRSAPGTGRGGRRQYKVIARLGDDVSLAVAEAAAKLERDRLAEESPSGSGIMKTWSFVITPAATGYSSQRKEFRQPLLMLMGIVGALLLIACANVAGLLLARAAARESELAMRAAIGASRSRLIRQLLSESLVLAVLGGVVGVALAFGGTASIGTLAASGPPTSVQWGATSVLLDMRPNLTVVLFTAAVCGVTTILFGLIPAVRAARGARGRSVIGRVAGNRTTGESVRLRSSLVVAQIAITLILLCSAAFFVRSIHNLRSEQLGFDRSRLLLAWLLPGYANASNTVILANIGEIQQRVAAIPGVTSVSATINGVFSGSAGASPRMRREGEQDAAAVFADDGRFVGPGFFTTVGQRVIDGREFRDSDGETAPRVIIVDQSFSRRMFGSASPVGRRLLIGGATAVPHEIIGVVADAKYSTPRAASWMTVYLPIAQARGLRRMCLVVQTAGQPAEMGTRLRRELAAVDPQLPVIDVDTVADQIDRVLFRERLVEQLATVFAGIALILACLGLYGVTSFLAKRQAREIGIRVALGARPFSILRLIGGQSLWLVGIGVGLGLIGTYLTRQLLATHLYAIAPGDPSTIAIVTAAFVAVGLGAACLPALRVAWSDPVRALQAD